MLSVKSVGENVGKIRLLLIIIAQLLFSIILNMHKLNN